MPLTISRGIMSLPPKKKIHDRYRSSKKQKLILLIVSDLDPAGDAIAEDILKSFRRDFAIENIEAYKVALTIEQVQQLGLNPSMEAKESSPTYTTFVNRYGITDAYELEAMTPTDLAEVLKTAIEQVIDMKLYKKELLAEQHDHEKIDVLREQIRTFIESLN